MRMKPSPLSIVGITSAILFSSAFAHGSAPAPTVAQRMVEINFMRGMIDHHQMAVNNAQLCVSKAVHQDLKNMCQNIISTQMHEIDLMQSWLTHWYGISHSPQIDKADAQMTQMLSSLEGSAFEIQFMKMITQHHWQAIVRASELLEEGYHHALEDQAEEMIKGQAKEISVMQHWLCDWYGICNWHDHGDFRDNQ
jgi:uncharacterized protein (DUF305 family)